MLTTETKTETTREPWNKAIEKGNGFQRNLDMTGETTLMPSGRMFSRFKFSWLQENNRRKGYHQRPRRKFKRRLSLKGSSEQRATKHQAQDHDSPQNLRASGVGKFLRQGRDK